MLKGNTSFESMCCTGVWNVGYKSLFLARIVGVGGLCFLTVGLEYLWLKQRSISAPGAVRTSLYSLQLEQFRYLLLQHFLGDGTEELSCYAEKWAEFTGSWH